MPTDAVILVFWSSLALLFFTFLGYPIFIYCLSRFRSEQPPPADSFTKTVTVVLSAHNEESRIIARLQNLLAADYPPEQFNLVVVSDGSTDETARQVRSLANPRVQLLIQSQRLGKAAALDRALAVAEGEIVVFADVRQTFAPDAIARLVRHFSLPQVGAVSGELMIDPAASSTGGGVDLYWRLEKFIRNAEGRWDSSIGCTGAIYAVRRELFQPLPPDTILDDVVIPMQVAQKGYRVGFDPEARAFDPQTLEPGREYVRKRRTLAGNYQMLFRHAGWLLPWRHRLWWQLIAHKYLRLAAPFFLMFLFLSNASLWAVEPYRFLFQGQCAFYALAICGFAFPSCKLHLFSAPAGFLFLNWMSLAGLWHYVSRRGQSAWEMNRPGASTHV